MFALVVLAACSRDAPQNFLHPIGPIAKEQDGLWRLTFGIAAAVFVIVEGLLVFSIFRFRARPHGAEPKQTHGNTKAEIAWTIAPVLLLTFVAFPTVSAIFKLAKEPTDPLQVQVVAHQWWWEYRYEGSGVVTANELHIPVGRPVDLSLESADVIHSYWVPKLAGKQDVIPGRVNHLTIQADEPGVFEGQCAEYCGFSHANMRLRVIAETESDFESWLQSQKRSARSPTDPLALEGQRLFLEGSFANGQQCSGCHAINGTTAAGTFGPDLTHLASRTSFAGSMFEMTDDDLVAWLRDPPGRKPGSQMPNLKLTDSQIQALVAYLNALT
ncbi:MAG TPA: cytochrome c oxidase subunit II [Actinomycetota bacterium]|nr:cytochrome c oxidase subunit II [Actinomycetota bacterium]